jgi:hypothetical protein
MKRATILTILLSSAFAFGQKIEMSDLSAAGSPVSLSVTVDSEDSRPFAIILAHNNSTKGVLALVATVRITDPHGRVLPITATQDYVFKAGVIRRAKDRGIAGTDWPLNFPSETSLPHSDVNVTPHADGVVLFVQFEDGSIWGDPQAAKRMIAARPKKLAFLQHLVEVYDMGGEAAFAAALDEPKPGQSPAFSVAGCLKADADHDKVARIDLARERLAAAQEWQASGIF